MAVLHNELQNKIDELGELAYEKFQNNEIDESFRLAEEAWALYPEPKENWNEAFNTAREIADDCFEIKDFDRAKKWINEMINVNNNLHQEDDYLSYYIGKYYFETGNLDEALIRFKEVVEEAGFRYFEDEDPKYLDFYRNPKKTHEIMEQELDDHIYSDIVFNLEKGDEAAEESLNATALKYYLTALDKIPEPKTDWEIGLHAYAALGDLFINMDQNENAVFHYESALRCPDGTSCGYVWLGLGQAYYELEDFEKAKDALMSAFMLEGEDIFGDYDPKYYDLIKAYTK